MLQDFFNNLFLFFSGQLVYDQVLQSKILTLLRGIDFFQLRQSIAPVRYGLRHSFYPQVATYHVYFDVSQLSSLDHHLSFSHGHLLNCLLIGQSKSALSRPFYFPVLKDTI